MRCTRDWRSGSSIAEPAFLMKRMREKEKLMASVSDEGDITVEGEFVGHLKGFHFVPDTTADGAHGRTLKAASLKAVAAQIAAKAQRFVQIPRTMPSTITLEGAHRLGRRADRQDWSPAITSSSPGSS